MRKQEKVEFRQIMGFTYSKDDYSGCKHSFLNTSFINIDPNLPSLYTDRVGRSGRVLWLTHLNVNISLNVYERNTYMIYQKIALFHIHFMIFISKF